MKEQKEIKIKERKNKAKETHEKKLKRDYEPLQIFNTFLFV